MDHVDDDRNTYKVGLFLDAVLFLQRRILFRGQNRWIRHWDGQSEMGRNNSEENTHLVWRTLSHTVAIVLGVREALFALAVRGSSSSFQLGSRETLTSSFFSLTGYSVSNAVRQTLLVRLVGSSGLGRLVFGRMRMSRTTGVVNLDILEHHLLLLDNVLAGGRSEDVL